MPKWLSQEWLEEFTRRAADQPERPGATVRLQYVLTDGPDGDISYYWVLEDGHLLENSLGKLADADVTLIQSYDDGRLIQAGELDATAAFMQGRIKATGDTAKLLSLLPITQSVEYRDLQHQMLEVTEF